MKHEVRSKRYGEGKKTFILYSLFSILFISSFFILVSAPTVHADITTGLVGHWKFDEGSGSAAGDSSGNNNTGTLTNGPTWTTGKIGSGALSFDGNNNYVYRSSITGGSTTEGTYSFWLYYRSGTRFDGLITSNSNTPVIYDDGNNIRARIDDDVGGYPIDMYEPVDILLNQWVFWTITYDANGGTIYKNGTAVASDGTGAASYAAISDIHIGSDKATGGRTIDGVMDDVRIYNRALSAADVAELYAYVGDGTPSPPPLAPVNGQCGTTNNSCIAGTLNDTTDSSTNYLWQCTGTNGGTTASCSLAKPSTPIPPLPSGGTITVSNASELNTALANATGGETILLNPGNYGTLGLFSRTFSSMVTIKSANPANRAVFSGSGVIFNFLSVTNLTVDTVYLKHSGGGGTIIIDGSDHIHIKNSTLEGSVDGNGNPTGDALFVYPGSSNITIDGNDMFTWENGLKINGDGLTVTNNQIHNLRSDAMQIGASTNILIEGNHLYDTFYVLGDHPDMIQFINFANNPGTRRVTIRGNFLDSGSGTASQSIFLNNDQDAGAGYFDVLIENNVIHNAHIWGIFVKKVSGLVIRNNTVLHDVDAAPDAHPVHVPSLLLSNYTNALVEKNIWPVDPGYPSDANLTHRDDLVIPRTDYSTVFIDAVSPGTKTLAQLAAVPGNLIYQQGVGSSLTRPDDAGASSPPPSTTPVNGSCGTTQNSCTIGAFSDITDSSTDYLWQCTGTNGGTTASCSVAKPSTPAPTITTSFSLGNRIQATANINVRNTGLLSPSTLIGTNPQGTLGTLVGGPTETNDAYGRIVWWDVDYDTGVDGWSGEGPFTLVSSPSPTVVNGQCGATQNFCTTGTLSDTADSTTNYLWQCVGSNGGATASCSLAIPPSAPPPSTTFTTNDTIQVSTGGGNLNVRQTPNGTQIGQQPDGATGTVTGGPTYANSLWWWEIDFTTGVNGWAAEDYLINYTTPPPADDGSSDGGTDGGSTSGGTTGGTTSGDTGGRTTSGGGGGGGSTVTTGGGGGGGSSPSTPSSSSGQATQTPEYTQQLLALIEQLRYLIQLLKSLGGTVSPELEALVNSFPRGTPYQPTATTGQTFTRNLTIGSRGEDVRQLQQYLNNNGFTVSQTRGGSPGLETTYFGTKTKAALIRYQEAHASQILHPLNLTRATGYFGPSTIKFIENQGI